MAGYWDFGSVASKVATMVSPWAGSMADNLAVKTESTTAVKSERNSAAGWVARSEHRTAGR